MMNSLNISGYSNLLGSVTLCSNLNISGYSNLLGNVSTNNNLNVYGNSVILNNISMNNTLNVSGNTVLQGNVTINSNIFINGNINNSLYHYIDNVAAKNAGVPTWGWYRNGGIVCIRLDDIPPTVYLSGLSSISVQSGLQLTDPGVYGVDNIDGLIPVYITSVGTGTTNFISSNILVTGTSTLVNLSSSSPGNYIISYQATDSSGSIGYAYRSLNMYSIINAYNLQTNNSFYISPLSNPIILNDWTFEIYVYVTRFNSFRINSVFDIRPQGQQGSLDLYFTNLGQIGIYSTTPYSGSYVLQELSTELIPLNTWTHICWMQKNNIGYGFINGRVGSNPANLYPTSTIYQLRIGCDNFAADTVDNPGKFIGNISQPLISNYAKYNTTGFTPLNDLTPATIDSSIIFFLGNNYNTFGQLSIYTLNNINNVSLLSSR